ncbi:hypothetical protein EON64_02845, partial [archaeon]
MKKKTVQEPAASFLREIEDSFYYAEVDGTSKSFWQADRDSSNHDVKQRVTHSAKKINRLVSFSELPQVDSSLSDMGSSMYDLNIPLSPLSSVQSSQQPAKRPIDSKEIAPDFLQSSFPISGPSSHSQSFLAYQARQQAEADSEDSVVMQLRDVDCHALDAELGLDKVLQLLDMGFPLKQVCSALRSCAGDVQGAILHCLEHSGNTATFESNDDHEQSTKLIGKEDGLKQPAWEPPAAAFRDRNKKAAVEPAEFDIVLDDDVVAAARSIHNLHSLTVADTGRRTAPQVAVRHLLGRLIDASQEGRSCQAEPLEKQEHAEQAQLHNLAAQSDDLAAQSVPSAQSDDFAAQSAPSAPSAQSQSDDLAAQSAPSAQSQSD